MENSVTIERLHALFSIDPATGVIVRRTSVRGYAAGLEAGGLSTKGYRQVRVDGRHIEGHLIAWALYHGAWPNHQIDHRNGVRDDNRRDNLRAATNGQNRCNSPIVRARSGFKGVYWNKHAKKWMASIKYSGRYKTLGYFADVERAAEFRQLAADLVHGEFANHG